MNVIEVDNLTKDYGSRRGVFDISFYVGEGEVFGFLGPNGAGKSTTIRHLMGFSRPDRGKTTIFNKPTFSKYYEILSDVGYIPGEIALPSGLTGKQFIAMMQSMQGKKNDEQLKKMLDMFELNDETLQEDTKHMSLGVKRKLAIVVAFMHDPDVLILDEPTSGLDPVMQEIFVRYIRSEKHRGKTILLSSHIFSEIDSTCDRIAIIKDGYIVSQFAATDLKHASRKFYSARFAAAEAADKCVAELRQIKSAQNVITRDDGVNFMLDDADINAAIKIIAPLSPIYFGNRRESLEDYFMKFYKEEGNFGGALK